MAGPEERGQGSGGTPNPVFLHTAQVATVVNLAFILAALLCALARPATLAAERAGENQ
jgi:hypothetical protein